MPASCFVHSQDRSGAQCMEYPPKSHKILKKRHGGCERAHRSGLFSELDVCEHRVNVTNAKGKMKMKRGWQDGGEALRGPSPRGRLYADRHYLSPAILFLSTHASILSVSCWLGHDSEREKVSLAG